MIEQDIRLDLEQTAISGETFVTLLASPGQIERLGELGVLSLEQLQAGRQAGGLAVKLPQHLVEEFERGRLSLAGPSRSEQAGLTSAAHTSSGEMAQIERLAGLIEGAGLGLPASLFIASNRPLNFFASQFLLALQPISRLLLGPKDPFGDYSRLLEKRSNLDFLLDRLTGRASGSRLKKKKEPR